MKAFAGLAVLAATLAVPAPRAAAATPGQFDSYVFSLEWTPAFCEGKSSLPECSSLTPGSFGATNLVLHGLWPDQNGDASHSYGYCGVDARTRSLDKGSTWCRMPDIGLSDATRSRLSTDMPGTASCLQNHEWYKHGSCSGDSPDVYFGHAADLVDWFAGSNFGRFVSSHTGQTVNASDLLDAFEVDFGVGTRGYVTLTCTQSGAGDLLLDVRVRLTAPLKPAAQLPQMLAPVAGAGNCPDSFLIDAAR